MDIVMLVERYGYAAVFTGTLLDHSGVPLYILAAGIILAIGRADPLQMSLIILCSIQLADLILIIVGRRFRSVRKPAGNRSRFLLNALNAAATAVHARPLMVYLASKWIPGVGKYAPVISGYCSASSVWILMLRYLPGNIFYAAVWLAVGVLGGGRVIGNSRQISIGLAVFFCVIYLVIAVSYRRKTRADSQKLNSQNQFYTKKETTG